MKESFKQYMETLNNNFLFLFCGKCHFKCELFIVPMCFKWIFQYANNILMKTTSVAESVLYGLWYDWSALSCCFWGNLVLEWTDEHTAEVWHFSSLGSQGPLFSLHFICLGSLLLENLIINLNLTPFIAAAGRSALFSQSYSQQVLIPCSLFFSCTSLIHLVIWSRLFYAMFYSPSTKCRWELAVLVTQKALQLWSANLANS